MITFDHWHPSRFLVKGVANERGWPSRTRERETERERQGSGAKAERNESAVSVRTSDSHARPTVANILGYQPIKSAPPASFLNHPTFMIAPARTVTLQNGGERN